MKLMSRLEKLHISGAVICPRLSLLTFPRLVICELRISSTWRQSPDVVQFPARHTTITHLTARLGVDNRHNPTIPLPGLIYLEAPSHIFERVVSPSLPAMRLIWARMYAYSPNFFDQTVLAFKALTNPEAPFISYQDLVDITSWYHTRIMNSLSQHMQHTATLCVRVASRHYP
ncbi:hypothetical protein FB45DRAFT_1060450 [Roridomyces roridus]|uniref:Uncharacterized protein n=1 Tax=Roridomyces roridus TaxID=1738132 RepID=A0AAD7BNG1_9AGAR|nr:hypothetical protein FB45DRAFT_1060450 [Roridomyces roridus]